MCIDIYSRFTWAKPMKTKSANNTYLKFVSVLQEEKYDKNDVVPN